MTLAAILAPAATLLAIYAIYHIYIRHHARSDAQQFIALNDPSYRTVRGVARFESDDSGRRAGVFDAIGGDGAKRSVDPSVFESARARVATGFGRRMTLAGDTVLSDDRFIDTLICTGDLTIRGHCVFLQPVKVMGDLIIEGNASFARPVIVNGHTRIGGVAAVFAGMVAKGEIAIDGTLLVGERGREGWLAARHVETSGKLLLNGYVDSIQNAGHSPAAAEPAAGRPNTMAAVALVVAGYLLSVPLGAWLMGQAGVACSSQLAMLHCAYPAREVTSGGPFALGVFALMAYLASRRWLRDSIAWPFAATMCIVALGAVNYDLILAHPIMHEGRIVSDTMNVLSFVMLASFILTLAILRRSHVPLANVAMAVAISFGAKTAAMLTFIAIRGAVSGATEMLLLFVIYAFGAFGIHLMAVTSLVRHARPAAPETVREGGAQKRGSAVDGVRGLAILLVVVHHYVPTEFFSFNLAKPINATLFVMAGFFFATVLLKHAAALQADGAVRLRTIGELLVRRHVRIWPVLASVIALYAVLAIVDGGVLPAQIWATWPYYLTYTGYIPRWAYEAGAFPPHLWAVSAQETALAFFCAGLAAFGLPRVRKVLWMLVVAGIAARFVGTLLFMPHAPALALETPFAVLDPLALGMLARFGMDRSTGRSQLRRRISMGLLAAVALWALLPNWNTSYFTLTPLIVSLATTFVMVLSADRVRGRGIGRSGLGAPWLVFLGRISLPLFLLHPLVNTVLRLVYTGTTGVEMPWWLLFAVGPCLSILAAWAFHLVIEQPLKRLSGRLRFRTPPVLAVVPAAPVPEPVIHPFARPVDMGVERRKRAA